MSDELKPCPFQGDGEEHHVRFVEWKPGYGQIECADCHFCIPGEAFVTRDEAVRRWNARAERTCEWHPVLNDENFATGCDTVVLWEPPTPPHCPYCGGRVKIVDPLERTCRMSHALLYDEEGIEGIECDECGWSDIHPWDEPMPERCQGCGAKVVG